MPDDNASEGASNVWGLSTERRTTSEPPQSPNCGSVCRQHPHTEERYSIFIDERCDLCFNTSRTDLRREVLKRARKVGTSITQEAYTLLEERMTYGGPCRLLLVYDDLDLLIGRYDEDPEGYEEIRRVMKSHFQMEYKDLLCLFSSQDMLIFLHRDRSDGLVYGFDDIGWNLLILGEENDWAGVIETYDSWLSPKLRKKALIGATRENREKYKAGWRPPSRPDGKAYGVCYCVGQQTCSICFGLER